MPEGPDFSVDDRERRPGDRHDRRAAARRAGDERPLRAERRQRPLGLALRRALRHRRHSRDRRRASAATATTRRAARGSIAWVARRSSTTPRRSRTASWRDGARLRGRGRRLDGRARAAARRPARAARRSSPAISATPAAPRAVPARATTACTSRSLIDATTAIGAADPAQHRRRLARGGAHRRSWTARIRSPPSTPRTRSLAYRNWLGLMKGDLTEEVDEGRRAPSPAGSTPTSTTPRPTARRCRVAAAALMLVRNVGHLMTNPAILDADGREVPEGILDAMVTALIALHDVGAERPARELAAPARSTSSSRRCTGPRRSPSPSSSSAASRRRSAWRPTRSRSASWTRSGARRSTSRNASARRSDRVVFINTGFLDRTGDEIHTSMEAGADDPQGRHEAAPPGSRPTRTATSTSGSPAACPGHAQIGKGMWAMPDLMAEMLEQKVGHPKAGRQHRLGAVADRGDAARDALPPGRRRRGAGRARRAASGRGSTTS